jgi:hypothetical protein
VHKALWFNISASPCINLRETTWGLSNTHSEKKREKKTNESLGNENFSKSNKNISGNH